MRNSVSSTRSTRSRPANFPQSPTISVAARPAASRQCAGRTTSMTESRLPFGDEAIVVGPESPIPSPETFGDWRPETGDSAARRAAVDPFQNVVLEASAGTGKPQVLVQRSFSLLRAGVEPDHILAITFTRKAAAEMRQRIIDRLKEATRVSEFDAARWRDLKERLPHTPVARAAAPR